MGNAADYQGGPPRQLRSARFLDEQLSAARYTTRPNHGSCAFAPGSAHRSSAAHHFGNLPKF
jgi:hypothetical protein